MRAVVTALVVGGVVAASLIPTAPAMAAGVYGDIKPGAVLRYTGPGHLEVDLGASVSVSADGRTAAVGAPAGRRASRFARVYVYVRTDGWHLQTIVSQPNHYGYNNFGENVSLSADGEYLAVSDTYSPRPGETERNAGEVTVYHRRGADWPLAATITDPGTGSQNEFGIDLAIDAHGDELLIASYLTQGSPTRIGGAWTVARAPDGTWGAPQLLPQRTGDDATRYPQKVALSGDGRTAVTAFAGAKVRYDDDGAAAVFERGTDGRWTFTTDLSDPHSYRTEELGLDVAVSTDNNTVVLGGAGFSDGRTGVVVFRRDGTGRRTVASFAAYNTAAKGGFGETVAVSADGTTVAVGAPYRSTDLPALNYVGGVYRYAEIAGRWSYLGPTYVRGARPDEYDGSSLALSGDASLLFIGAPGRTTAGKPAGAVYVVG